MFWQWIKKFLPRGLYGRAALILIVPVIAIQLVVSVVFIQRHFNGITRQMTGAVVLELGYLLDRVNAAETLAEAQAEIETLNVPLALSVELPGQGPAADDHRWYDLTASLVIRTLREGLPGITGIDLATQERQVFMGIDTVHGPMALRFGRARLSASNPHQLLVLMVATGILMTLVAYLFLRNQLRPIRRLGRAADAFGKGEVLPYRVSGATEVRAAGRAFLDMRARIERQIEQRTMMLSGVSHDLRTPLTRLRLGLEMLDAGDERDALLQDVSDMERLVDEFLSFARSDALAGEPEQADPAAIARRAVENAVRAGQAVELGVVESSGPLRLRPVAVERALDNLLSNAARHGTRARLSVEEGQRELRFVVEDDGPGIPEEAREQALKPFARLDAARRGSGVGLGLAIANDIARGHGGRVRLGESRDLGGLRAELVLAR